MDYKSLLMGTSLLLVAALFWPATAAPRRRRREAEELVVTPRWHQPCAGSRLVDTTSGDVTLPEDITPAPFDAREHYVAIRRRAVESRNKTQSLMTRITTERIMQDIERDLQNVRLSGLPEIPDSPSFTQNVLHLLNTSHDWLMRFAVYIEQMRIDESTERDELGEAFSLLTEVVELEEDAIYWLLCKLKSAMQGHGVAPETLVGRDIYSERYHRSATNRALRHTKNLIVLRDLRAALEYMVQAFDIVIAGTRAST